MTYIDYLNAFNQWLETNALPASSQLMFYKLLYVFNRAGWPEYVGVDNLRLMLMTDTKSEKTVIRARDKLVESGFITYKKGRKGMPNQYSLCNKYCKNYSTNDSESEIDCKNYSVSDSISASVSDSISASENDSHIKTKTKKKTKTKETSPDGEVKKAAIAAVMSAYLDKINPQLSERSRDELAGFVEVMGAECCLRAIDIALDNKAAKWPYIKSILQTKQSQGVRCLADWDAAEEQRRKPQTTQSGNVFMDMLREEEERGQD